MAHEREVAEEQAFLDLALARLDHMRDEARSLRDSAAVANMRGAGDLVERDVVMGTALHRLDQLAIGDQPLFFGRIDYAPRRDGPGDIYHVGRLAVSDEQLNPLVVDWRAPVAEAFYRATGVESLGLSRRRHVAIRGHEVTGVEDEYFADANGRTRTCPRTRFALPPKKASSKAGSPSADPARCSPRSVARAPDAWATSSRRSRASRTTSSAARWRASCWSRAAPAPARPPSRCIARRTCCSPIVPRWSARACLVVGPNPLFLNYIENVLPSLGESGVTLSTISGLVTNVEIRGATVEEVDQLKGDVRMAHAAGSRAAHASTPTARAT